MASLGADTFTQQQIRQSVGKALHSADNAVNKEIKEELARVSGKFLSLTRQLIVRPTYLSNRIIWSNPNKTTTLIGKWSELVKGQENGLKKVFSELSETDLNIYMKSGKFDNFGGFNMLSIEDWGTKVVQEARAKGIVEGTKAFDDYIWETYNKPWLENAMQRGDDIILWSNPNLKLNMETYYKKENILGKSFYGREIEFIENNASKYGYDYNRGISIGIFSK